MERVVERLYKETIYSIFTRRKDGLHQILIKDKIKGRMNGGGGSEEGETKQKKAGRFLSRLNSSRRGSATISPCRKGLRNGAKRRKKKGGMSQTESESYKKGERRAEFYQMLLRGGRNALYLNASTKRVESGGEKKWKDRKRKQVLNASTWEKL